MITSICHSLCEGGRLSFFLPRVSFGSYLLLIPLFIPTTVRYTARLSSCKFNKRFCRLCSLDTRNRCYFCVFQTENSDDILDVLRVRCIRVPTDCSFDHSAQKQLFHTRLPTTRIMTCVDKMFGPKNSIINMNEDDDVQVIVSDGIYLEIF